MTIWEARNDAANQLKLTANKHIEFSTPLLDSDCLLSHVLEKNRTFLLAHSHDVLKQKQLDDFFELIDKRKTGIPVAYLTNNKEFFGYDFFVNQDVLIPKPDTEILVQKTIDILVNLIEKNNTDFRIADICTGSACIPLSILRYLIDYTKFNTADYKMKIDCVDISQKALEIAKINAKKLLGTEQNLVEFYQGDLLAPLAQFESYDCILSNPPYIPSALVDELLLDGRSEPRIALDGDIDSIEAIEGMTIINRLIPQAYQKLTRGGYFIIETGEYNAHLTAQLMKAQGFFDVFTYNDLSNQPRVTIGRKK